LSRKEEERELLICSCCGKYYKGYYDGTCDTGYGYCKNCGGDPESKDIKKQMGWGMRAYCEARFPILREALNEKNRKKFDECSYEKKCYLVLNAVEKGYLRW